MNTTTTSFRQSAEARIAQLEDRERERQVQREARAAEARASQAQDRERREHAQRQAADQAAAEARARLARRFGLAATSLVDLGAEVYLFVIEHRGLAVVCTRTKGDDRRVSWQHQARLQQALNTGVTMPLIVTGAQILTYTEAVDRLVVDPDVAELAALNPTSRGST